MLKFGMPPAGMGEKKLKVDVVRRITPFNERGRPQPHEFREGSNIPFPETDHFWNPWNKWTTQLNEFNSHPTGVFLQTLSALPTDIVCKQAF
ncbi:hypothetical protein ONS95_006512 [Cadophora gregata]|uniref:uncharacterized protein n=1 Tax=Cadophora gregata TaxID=51156 RepID=UPI0026DCAF15|nr:uncharacterized protein ONS95_006512 [Cadophora gregata]KAK0101336.1 hypothetical protein ONS95_006512 [Cadophora gregata]KAK0106653.1 hypothetical protein ONS96_004273 [Cadophora gregata f. sp. sojae]